MNTEIISMDSIRRIVANTGSHWFEPASMRFFGTRLPQSGLRDVRGCIWFVSSEARTSGPRKYSVRRFSPEGRMSTPGGFHTYATRAAANRAMQLAITASADPRHNNEE